MTQVLPIQHAVFDQASRFASTGESVSSAPASVAAAQPSEAETVVQSLPAWYLTPVALVPIAAAAFIIGNILMMIPWSIVFSAS